MVTYFSLAESFDKSKILLKIPFYYNQISLSISTNNILNNGILNTFQAFVRFRIYTELQNFTFNPLQ